MADELKEIKEILKELKSAKADQSLFSTTTKLDNEAPIWNASHIANIPLDTSHKKDGWGFLMNKGKFEMFPVGDPKFYDHDKLTNYRKVEHAPLLDNKDGASNLWSAAKTKKEIEDSRKKANITTNKEISKVKSELRDLAKNSAKEGVREEARMLLKAIERAQSDIESIRGVVGLIGTSQDKMVTFNVLNAEISKLHGDLVKIIEVNKKKNFSKDEIKEKFKALTDEIKEVKKAAKDGTLNQAIKDLKLNKADWGHEHMSKDIKHDGQRLNEYLAGLNTGGDTLPDQSGNTGKFLKTDGSALSWDTPAGSGDMTKAVYDPTGVEDDAFDVDNHVDGTTNKVYTATEKTKLAGIEASADVTDAGNVGSTIHGATGKTTPVDADTTAIIDSAASNALKKVTWANIKATLKTYFDTIYQAAGSYITASSTDTLTNKTIDANGTGNSITNIETADLASGVLDTDLSSVSASDNTLASAKAIKAALDGKSDTSHSHALDGLSDVTITAASSGQVIKYNGSAWVNDTDSTGAGGVADGDKGDITVADDGATWTIDAGVVTYAKIQNVSATDRILGRDTAGAGSIEEITPANLRTMINVEDGADVTDATNVAAAGAVMESDTSTASMSFVIDEDNMATDSATKVPTQQSVKAYADTKQPLDTDLTTIAGLTPTTNNFMVANSSAWASRTPTQAIAHLGLDADIATLSLPASTTITAAAATVLDDATVAAMVDTLGGASSTGSGGLVRATSPTLVTPNLGTPSAINLTNGTALPVSGITASTSTALGVGSLELGHATANTLTASGGVLSIEGVVIPTVSSSNTLTNKQIHVTAAPGSDHTVSGTTITLTANENQAIGDVCYINADGEAQLADADAIASSKVVAMATESITANNPGTYLLNGIARDDTWNWTVGDYVYLSTTGTTGNTLTQTAPSATDDCVVIVGIATHADRMLFNPQLVIVEHA